MAIAPTLPQPFCGIERRGDDPLIAGAAAQIAGDGDPHLLLGGIGIVAQELDQRGEHPRRAEPALQPMMLVKRLLQRVQLLLRGRDALDGQNLVPVCLNRQHQARARRAAVEQDRAGSAHAVLAAEMGAGQAELVAHEIGQRPAHLYLLLVALAVDRQRDLSRLAHVASLMCSAWRRSARARMRLIERAPRQHGRQMLAIGGRSVHVVDRLELAATLAGIAEQRLARPPRRRASARPRARAPAPCPCRRSSPRRG